MFPVTTNGHGQNTTNIKAGYFPIVMSPFQLCSNLFSFIALYSQDHRNFPLNVVSV